MNLHFTSPWFSGLLPLASSHPNSTLPKIKIKIPSLISLSFLKNKLSFCLPLFTVRIHCLDGPCLPPSSLALLLPTASLTGIHYWSWVHSARLCAQHCWSDAGQARLRPCQHAVCVNPVGVLWIQSSVSLNSWKNGIILMMRAYSLLNTALSESHIFIHLIFTKKWIPSFYSCRDL